MRCAELRHWQLFDIGTLAQPDDKPHGAPVRIALSKPERFALGQPERISFDIANPAANSTRPVQPASAVPPVGHQWSVLPNRGRCNVSRLL